ncbi:TRAF3-interacting protein 1 [Bagarius yarrelli]|uniref:TRAF3-interacting protein 1 n=1 Tax=Bagarius yarrelli TaxID=175774 RepID=A0A556VAH7_BAGYA|nr:TRAF3-interacting protein 1 [Bagarius yarrelli]
MHMEGREGPGRREPMPAPFRAETRWGAPRGDLDERDMRGMSAGPPKSFPEDPGNPNFQNRFEMRGGGAMGGAGPGWTRGGGGGGPFNMNMHQDFDDRRRPWERQKDRDDRDFRRDINDNRHRDRDRERERDRERGRDRNRERERDRDRDNDKERERERGGWAPVQPQPLLPLPRPSQPLLPLPTPLLNLPPTQPESHPKPQPASRPESQPDGKQPQPEKQNAGEREKTHVFSDIAHGPDTEHETVTQPTAESSRSSSPAPTAELQHQTQTPEVSASTGGRQTPLKEEAETGTEPELVKTDTEET